MIGTSESAKVNAVLVMIKVTALTAFIILTLPKVDTAQFNPFLPAGLFGGFGTGVGAVGAAATIFFAYVGFDAVSTAAEETKNPQRNVPIGLVGSLLFCTVFYILVAAGAIGTIGGQPVMVGIGSQHAHRLDQTEADDAARVGAGRRIERGLLKRRLHRATDVRLAVDQRAVAIEDGQADGRGG